ncbi:MAG TPA: hypothetical protein VK158_03210 [Acidobacteriota bacterium]|nr:hypothetical protein [Acidobacteriota bacterium]
MQKRGQVSIEYLLTVGFVLAIIIPVSVLAYNSYAEYRDTLQTRQVYLALTTVSDHAQSVYNIGPPSFSTVNIYFPDSVQSIFFSNETITARMQTQYGQEDITVFTSVPLSGSLSAREGTRSVLVTATGSGVSIAES